MGTDVFVFVTFREDQQQPFSYLNGAPTLRTSEQGRLQSFERGSSLLRHRLLMERTSPHAIGAYRLRTSHLAKINRRSGLRNTLMRTSRTPDFSTSPRLRLPRRSEPRSRVLVSRGFIHFRSPSAHRLRFSAPEVHHHRMRASL